MSISSENILFVYRDSDTESIEIAELYKSIYNLSDEQMLSISTPFTDILDSYEDFYNYIEYPIYNKIQDISSTNDIFVIVLGFNIPYAFNMGDPYIFDPYSVVNTISSTSRLSNINHIFSPKTDNYLYNKQIYNSYNENNAQYSMICSSLSFSTKEIVYRSLLNSVNVKNQKFIYGKFYFNPYNSDTSIDGNIYKDELLKFQNLYLDKNNIDYTITKESPSGYNSFFPNMNNDSIGWTWTSGEVDSSFFGNSNNYRVFFYNADSNDVLSIKDEDSNQWGKICMNAGYMTCATSVGDTEINDFLRPLPFFQWITQDVTIGECFLYSCPFLNWTIGLFGDPMVTFRFSNQNNISLSAVDDTKIDENEIWRLLKEDASRILSYLFNRKQLSISTLNVIINSYDPLFEIATLEYANILKRNNTDDQISKYVSLFLSEVISYPGKRFYNSELTNAFALNDYLTQHEYKISDRLLDNCFARSIVDQDNLFDDYYFFIEFNLPEENNTSFYNFYLEIAKDRDFDNIVFTSDSIVDQDSWFFEKYNYTFENIPTGGVPYSYYNKRIKFAPSENLFQTILENQYNNSDPYDSVMNFPFYNQPYFIRITPYDISMSYDSIVCYDIIYTSGEEYEYDYNYDNLKGQFTPIIYEKLETYISYMQWSSYQCLLLCDHMLGLLSSSSLSQLNIILYQMMDNVQKIKDIISTKHFYDSAMVDYVQKLHEYILGENGDINNYYQINNIKITNFYNDILRLSSYDVDTAYIENII